MTQPTGSELLAADDRPEVVRQLAAQLLARAARAREDVCAFAEFVFVTEHDRKPVKLSPHQRVFFEFAQYSDRVVNLFPPDHGKAIADDTPMLTRRGWVRADEVVVGDHVPGSDGEFVRVTAVHVQGVVDLYRVRFTDASSLVTCADHLWEVSQRYGSPPQRRTTGQLADDLLEADGRRKWRIPVVAPVRGDHRAELPVDPYVLGVWLGDGTSCDAAITTADSEIIDAVRAAGFETSYETNTNTGKATTYGILGLRKPLRLLGVLNHKTRSGSWKHIPDSYLTAPVADRLALLQGLCDTDGTVAKNGSQQSVCTTSERLFDDIKELICSLGGTYTVHSRPAAKKVAHNVYFRLPHGMRGFRLARKMARLHPDCPENAPRRFVRAVEPVGRGPARCFTVDAADHLYCAGSDYVVTHNTWSSAVLLAWLLGCDPSARWAIVSHTQAQAEKVLKIVRDTIENNLRLRLVFPKLRRSDNRIDPWTQSAITVERPRGIRDASVIAVGHDGKIAGARLSGVLIDDIHDMEEVESKDQRKKIIDWVDHEAMSRLDNYGGRAIVNGTARHPEDLPHTLKNAGWATLTMDVLGRCRVQDDDRLVRAGLPAFDSDYLVPDDFPFYRFKGRQRHDPLWPERVPLDSADPRQKTVERLRREHLPHRFQQLFMQEVRDDSTAMCQLAWIENCKRKARERGIHGLSSKWDPPAGQPRLVFCGVDLAVSPGEESDDTCFFTFAVLPDGCRLILDIDRGKFNGPTIVSKLIAKQRQYDAIVIVESNAAQQYIQQFVLDKDAAVPVEGFMTGRAKAHPEHGVPGLFIELYNGAWLIPNDERGRCHPQVQKWVDECLYYVPDKHTGDSLMACYFAREKAKSWGVLTGAGTAQQQGAFGLTIMSR